MRRWVWVLLVLSAVVFLSDFAAASRRAPPTPTSAPTPAATPRATVDTATRERADASPTRLPGDLLAFAPPRATARPKTIVYMHGAHGRAEKGCPVFRAAAADLGWLVCPEAVDHDADGATSWGANIVGQGAILAETLRTAQAAGASPDGAIAVGFSQGAYAAVDLVKFMHVRFAGLVLIGADMHPSAATFRDGGVRRVAFASGRYDVPQLRAVAEDLAREGVDARYFDMGNVGHTYLAEDPQVLDDAIAWASAE